MEEARVAFMDSIGWSYQRFEDEGIVSPVTAVECKFRHSTEGRLGLKEKSI